MHVLVVNDDGPPSQLSSPYVHPFVDELQNAGVTVSVVLPHTQRPWIGKAHIAHTIVKPTYFRPGTLHTDDGTIHTMPRQDGGEEWILIDGIPASCVQIGLYHYFQEKGPIDMVISGPNYGRNSTALFSLSSGTIGGAMEGALCCKKSVALSYAFLSRNHDPVQIKGASQLSIRLIKHLYANWGLGIDLYTINVPLAVDHSRAKVLYTNILPNFWTLGSSFEEIEAPAVIDETTQERERELWKSELPEEPPKGEVAVKGLKHKHFRWAPKFANVYRSVEESGPGSDGWTVKEGHVSITPLKANFMHVPGLEGELSLPNKVEIPALEKMSLQGSADRPFYALVKYEDEYVQPKLLRALERIPNIKFIQNVNEVPKDGKIVQWSAYEQIDFDHLLGNSDSSLACSYIIRKALIRKHFLAHTIHVHVTKSPASVLSQSFAESYPLELDYAEYLDEALAESYELRDSLVSNDEKSPDERCWWILKPSMSDRGQGIRLFSTVEELEGIFASFEEDPDEEDERNDDEDDDSKTGTSTDYGRNKDTSVVTSQLRHFLVQKYIHPPLILASNRKFHIRTYVLAVGSLKVYVYKNMLALFAVSEYKAPWEARNEDLSGCLTNTCLQTGERDGSVQLFWDLQKKEMLPSTYNKEGTLQDIWEKLCKITRELFSAAAMGQRVHFQALPNAFEIFGIDFMVDVDLNVSLLEVNSYPDFKQTGDELSSLIDGLFEGVVDVAVKPFLTGVKECEAKNMEKVLDIELGSW
ncbi:tubulin-tyrosine ligase family-domain-containing protein [Terfezia claveryi]|nr:tubulin-tyrosine ligase family-domain-containing protein [Terfezia claveryi]